MAEKNIPAWVKPALEFGPLVLFFIGYLRLKGQNFEIAGGSYDGFIIVTALFIPLILLSTGLMWWLTGVISKMQVMTAVLVTVFGGLTVWLNDERFIKMKPTIIYLIFGGGLAVGLLQGKSYLEYMMGELMPLQPEGWAKLTQRMMLFFFGLAILNEAIWRGFSTETWVYFKTFGLTAALFIFLMSQYALIEKYGIDKDA